MGRVAARIEDGTVHLSTGESLPLLNAALDLAGQRVWVYDIHRVPHALREARLCDAATLADALHTPRPSGDEHDLASWVDDMLDAIDDDDAFEDVRLTVDQQRTWWRVLQRGFRIDRDALRDMLDSARRSRRLTTLELGTDLFFSENAQRFLETHGIHIARPDDPEDAPTRTSHRLWHHAEVPEGAERAWTQFMETRSSLTTLSKLEEIARSAGTGRVWTHWHVSGADTGRMSSSEIAMQNIAKSIRPVFVADTGCVLVKCDLDRAEPSVAAWLSGDRALLRDLTGGDVYQALADRIGTTRSTAKIVLLSLLYGKGTKRLAFDLSINYDEAAQVRADLLDAYPDLKRWMRRLIRDAERGRGVTTAFGRHIPLDPDQAYKAVNYTAQGTAAGVLLEMVDNIVRHPLLGEDTLWLAVHDEVILQVPEADDYRDVLAAFAACMTFEVDGVRIAGTPEVLGERWRATE